MSNDSALDASELRAALAVLDREQAAFLPTKRENIAYRAFNIITYVMSAILVLELASLFVDIIDYDMEDYMHFVFLALGTVTLILFSMNFGLIRKLYKQAKLRRRLKLVYYFNPVFRERRRASWGTNLLTICITVLGVLLIFISLLLSLVFFAMWIEPGSFLSLNSGEFAVALSGAIALIWVGLGLASLHFMRRGKERLEIVMRLRETLSKQTAEPAQGGAAAVLSSEDYGILAKLEREHIITSRASSIVAGRKEAGSSGYLCLSSKQMTEAKSKLPEKLLSRVDETVMALLANPLPSSTTRDPQTGNYSVPVPDTELSIQYDVNMDRHLIRLHGLQGERRSRTRRSRDADGFF